jgi:hypothetical protein
MSPENPINYRGPDNFPAISSDSRKDWWVLTQAEGAGHQVLVIDLLLPLRRAGPAGLRRPPAGSPLLRRFLPPALRTLHGLLHRLRLRGNLQSNPNFLTQSWEKKREGSNFLLFCRFGDHSLLTAHGHEGGEGNPFASNHFRLQIALQLEAVSTPVRKANGQLKSRKLLALLPKTKEREIQVASARPPPPYHSATHAAPPLFPFQALCAILEA